MCLGELSEPEIALHPLHKTVGGCIWIKLLDLLLAVTHILHGVSHSHLETLAFRFLGGAP